MRKGGKHMNNLLPVFWAAVVALAAGCFREPVPAYTTVAPETRIYLKESALKTLALEDIRSKGMVYVPLSAQERKAAADAVSGANFAGAWAKLSDRPGPFNPAEIEYLNLDRNVLESVDVLASLVALKWLRLNGNRLSSLPDLSALADLRRIYLADNRFETVPETLASLPRLTDIDLSGNPIKEVPAWLAAKRGLENLSLSRTAISSLPEDLSAWEDMGMLQLGELKLSAEEMARVRKALPQVRIVF